MEKRNFSMKKTIAIVLVLVLGVALLTACGGSGDALSGTWKGGELLDDGSKGETEMTWTFDGKGECTFDNTMVEQEGTYTIDGSHLTIQLEMWYEERRHTFTIEGSTLIIKTEDPFAPSYELAKQ
jgi:ABC-type glycerol-3-phosphate transport system substrate-binding protein